MTDQAHAPKPDRPALPRDSFRPQRASTVAPAVPVVVTPDYDERHSAPVAGPKASVPPKTPERARPRAGRDPLRAYGERSSSRPYALRLPEPIDLALRHVAAEEHIQPLRIIDRLIDDELKRIGRLPPLDGP